MYDDCYDKTRCTNIQYQRHYAKSDHLQRCLKKHKNIPFNVRKRLEYTFKKISLPLQNVYKDGRKNFLNYPYVIRKILELNGDKDYINQFPILKSEKRILEHDKIWYKLCKIMNMEFIPTI